MAEGKDSGVKDLEEEITCGICHEHYQEPKVLSCCHYYCKQCIYRLALRTGLDKPFSCPECHKDTTLPQGGVDNLQGAFFVNRLKHVHSKLERATGKVEAKCEMCSEDKAEAFCRHCMMFICAECVKQHKKLKVFAGHKTSSLDGLKEGGAREFITPEPTLQTCKVHNESMKFYCFDCSCLICRDCTVDDHLGHKYQFVRKAALEAKKKLSQQLGPLQETKNGLVCVVKEVQTTRSELEAEGHAVVGQIEKWCDEFCQIIQNHKKQLVQEVESKITQKSGGLSGQEKQLSTSCAGADSVIEFTQHCMEHLTDDEIVCMYDELQSRIDRAIEEQQKAGNSLEPVEEVDLAIDVKNSSEELKQLCHTTAKIIQILLDPSKCTVTLKGAENAEVGKLSEVMLHINLANGKPTKQKCAVECHLKSLVDGSSSKCEVDHVDGHKYHIQYTPTVRGRHELSVTVNGVEVADSPFPVFASIHPNQLSKPVRVITGLNHPIDVACNSEGKIIVCEYNGDVVLMDKKGKRLSRIKRSGHNLKHPRGVAVDGDNNIYFVDESLNVIFKSDKEMNLIEKKFFEHNGTPGHLCVAVVGDEVMVCERFNKGTIKVYSKELEYVREIVSPQKNETFCSISSDEHGNLYTCEVTNSCIVVFKNGGQFVRSFGCDENGVKKLDEPTGVCVTSQYVYVPHRGNNISVFTTQGQYVTSFGQKGKGEGEFNDPIGVCVDRDGFVYVCDYFNTRVQVF